MENGKEAVSYTHLDVYKRQACRAFVSDVNFKSTGDSITGWQLLNLLNGSVKSSYIDNFLERNLNCTEFVQGIQRAKLGDSEYAWFLG